MSPRVGRKPGRVLPGLGQLCESPRFATLQPDHGAEANLDLYVHLHGGCACTADPIGLSSGDGAVRRRPEPDLPGLDSRRGVREDASLVRIRDEYLSHLRAHHGRNARYPDCSNARAFIIRGKLSGTFVL